MRYIRGVMVLGGIAVVGVGGFVYSGWYPIGADVPHSMPVYWLLETLRERSIAAAAREISVPPLDDSQLLLAGGRNYNEMCAGCHLQPGRTESDISVGLYPSPPNLAGDDDERGDDEAAARRQFWIIKHGIKASGMPAWGPTHDDQRIWAMVAFLQKLPGLTAAQYQILTAHDDGGTEPADPSHIPALAETEPTGSEQDHDRAD